MTGEALDEFEDAELVKGDVNVNKLLSSDGDRVWPSDGNEVAVETDLRPVDCDPERRTKLEPDPVLDPEAVALTPLPVSLLDMTASPSASRSTSILEPDPFNELGSEWTFLSAVSDLLFSRLTWE
jgi:hypothetical protein